MSVAALLLGRKGSTGLPGKNLRPVLGRPLVAYPLLAAQASGHVDRILRLDRRSGDRRDRASSTTPR